MRCPYCNEHVDTKDWIVGIFKCPSCKKLIRITEKDGKLEIIKA